MKKILFLSILPFFINSAAHDIIKGATYFKVHKPKNTLIHIALGYRYTNDDADRSQDDVKESLDQNKTCVTFHDRQWRLIETHTLSTDLNPHEIVKELKKKLDPEKKPEVTHVSVGTNALLGRVLTAFDAWDQPLFTVAYADKVKLKNIKQRIAQIKDIDVDISKLKTCEDTLTKKQKCIVQ
jgi:hypothetical protein